MMSYPASRPLCYLLMTSDQRKNLLASQEVNEKIVDFLKDCPSTQPRKVGVITQPSRINR